MENPIKMDDLGGFPLFLEIPIYEVIIVYFQEITILSHLGKGELIINHLNGMAQEGIHVSTVNKCVTGKFQEDIVCWKLRCLDIDSTSQAGRTMLTLQRKLVFKWSYNPYKWSYNPPYN